VFCGSEANSSSMTLPSGHIVCLAYSSSPDNGLLIIAKPLVEFIRP
jgi:hypothetical protein